MIYYSLLFILCFGLLRYIGDKVVDEADRAFNRSYSISVGFMGGVLAGVIFGLSVVLTYGFYYIIPSHTIHSLEVIPITSINEEGDFAVRSKSDSNEDLYTFFTAPSGEIGRLMKRKGIESVEFDDKGGLGPRIEQNIERIPTNLWTEMVGLDKNQIKIEHKKLILGSLDEIIEDYEQEEIDRRIK